MPEIQLPYGDGALEFWIPEANLTGMYAPQSVVACGDPVAEILSALTHPLDTPVLPRIVRPGEKVVILVDDHTRVTPVAQIDERHFQVGKITTDLVEVYDNLVNRRDKRAAAARASAA